MAERWLETITARGLQGLLALRLHGAPGADAVSLTLDIWLAALSTRAAGWTERDAERIEAAFRTLYATCKDWPVPCQLLAVLPPPKPPPALPAPALTPEERQRNIARLNEMMKNLNQAKELPPAPALTPEQHAQKLATLNEMMKNQTHAKELK